MAVSAWWEELRTAVGEGRHTVQMVRRMVVVADSAEADTDRAEEDIGPAEEEDTGLEEEERHRAVAVGDKDYGMEHRMAVVAEDTLAEGLEGGSRAAGVVGHIGLVADTLGVGHNLEAVLVVVERRSPVAAGILAGDTGRVGAADSRVEENGPHRQDIHLVEEDMTCLRGKYTEVIPIVQRVPLRNWRKREAREVQV